MMKIQYKYIHLFFKISLFLKIINALLEMSGGLFLLLLDTSSINKTIAYITQVELAKDSRDILANAILHLSHNLSTSTKVFGAIYLLSHGLVKIGLIIGLLKKRLWAYPASILFFILFIIYQLHRLTIHYSMGMMILTLLDLCLVWLVYLEYKHVRAS